MKEFLAFIGKLLLILLLTAILMDAGYTFVYLKSTPRNKIESVMNSENKNYDVVFMGSSRTQNHLVAQLFNGKGYNTFNYGMSGSKLDETALLLELMLERHYKIKNIILDVDLNLNSNSTSERTKAMYMPYLHTSETIRNHYKSLPDYTKLLYIPFYRYINYEAKIGFREVFFSASKKKSNAMDNLGYFPLKHTGTNMKYNLSDYKPKRNFGYEKIKSLCQKNHINLIAITTPMCENTVNRGYFDHIQAIYPEVHRYENAVKQDKYFSSCGHLNVQGATLLTTTILNDFIHNKLNH